MSDAYAIAAVTVVIRRTILEFLSAANLSDVVGTVPVTAIPPDRVLQNGAGEPTQVNIFLHQISRNAALRNNDLPSRNAAGVLVAGPPLAIDLHYLITAYGAEPFQAEMVLGHAALALHENAVMTREGIARALSPVPPDALVPAALASSGIDAQMEMIKIVPEAVDGEEMSRLWSAIQGQYRPTAAYRVSVLTIDPRAAGATPPPVLRPGGRAVTKSDITLDAVADSAVQTDPITLASTVIASGQGFVPGEMELSLGGVPVLPLQTNVSSSAIEVDLAATTELRAGLQGARALRVHTEPMPPETPMITLSNTVAITLRPVIAGLAVAISATDTVDGQPVSTGTVTVTFGHEVGRDQAASVFLNIAGAPGAHRLSAPPNNGAQADVDTVTQIAFGFRRLLRGPYLIRASIDGADSLLTTDGNGVFDGPEVVL